MNTYKFAQKNYNIESTTITLKNNTLDLVGDVVMVNTLRYKFSMDALMDKLVAMEEKLATMEDKWALAEPFLNKLEL